MLRRGFLLLILAVLSLSAETRHTANLDRIIEECRKAYQAPGVAVAIVSQDSVVYAKGFGVKQLGSTDPVTSDTRFAIGSTTKAFTTAAMGILIDQGKMSWDDPVRKHVPFFRLSDPLADANVTMRDIVSHRTGLSRNDMLWYNSPWTREEVIRKIGLVPLTKPFRSAYQYQNIMFLTAGYAVGLTSGSTWEAFVQSNILDRLGMKNTDFSTKDVVKAKDYATPHIKRDEVITAIPWRNIDNIGPAGSINSSVNDLARWVRMHLNKGSFEGKQIVQPATLQEMHTPQMVVRNDDPDSRALLQLSTHMASYGLGWIIQDYRGHHMVSHGGAIDGFRAQVTLLPDEHYGIVVLSNLGSTSLPESLRFNITDELLGLSPMDWNKRHLELTKKIEAKAKKTIEDRKTNRATDTKPSHQLNAYAGTYQNPAYGTATVENTASGLELRWSNWKLTLEHFHYDVFRVKSGAPNLADSFVDFQTMSDGKLARLTFADQDFTRSK